MQSMIDDAKAHAEDDKKFKEMIELRNKADSMIHNSEKSLKELESELSSEEKTNIESAIGELREAIKGSDQALIEAKLATLTEVSSKMAERIYAKQASAEPQASSVDAEQKPEESVLDAEFEEVKDDKK